MDTRFQILFGFECKVYKLLFKVRSEIERSFDAQWLENIVLAKNESDD